MTKTFRKIVQCPGCNARLFDGEVVKGISVLKVVETGSEGMCKRCKTWVPLPFVYSHK